MLPARRDATCVHSAPIYACCDAVCVCTACAAGLLACTLLLSVHAAMLPARAPLRFLRDARQPARCDAACLCAVSVCVCCGAVCVRTAHSATPRACVLLPYVRAGMPTACWNAFAMTKKSVMPDVFLMSSITTSSASFAFASSATSSAFSLDLTN